MPKRVVFLCVACVVLASSVLQVSGRVERYDLLIANARVMDGMGNPWVRADVAVTGGRTVAVGKLDGEAGRTIDAHDLVLAPGFVDVHSHAGETLGNEPWGSRHSSSTPTAGAR